MSTSDKSQSIPILHHQQQLQQYNHHSTNNNNNNHHHHQYNDDTYHYPYNSYSSLATSASTYVVNNISSSYKDRTTNNNPNILTSNDVQPIYNEEYMPNNRNSGTDLPTSQQQQQHQLSRSLPIRIKNSLQNESTNLDDSFFYDNENQNRQPDSTEPLLLETLVVSPSTRPLSIWNCDSTTPMTSRPHFCSIQPMIILSSKSRQPSITKSPQQQHATMVLGDDESSIITTAVLHPTPPQRTTSGGRPRSRSHSIVSTTTAIDNDHSLQPEASLIMEDNENDDNNIHTSDKNRSSFVLTRHSIYGSGDLLLVPSLLSTTYNNKLQHQQQSNEGKENYGSLLQQQLRQYHQEEEQQQHVIDEQYRRQSSNTTSSLQIPIEKLQQEGTDYEIYSDHPTELHHQQQQQQQQQSPLWTTVTDSNGSYHKNDCTTNQDTSLHSIESKHETSVPSSLSSETIIMCCMYGLINATIVLPVLMSFGSIVYRDDAFQPYQQYLIQLTVFSGIVHQLSFSTFSTLPFAVGQVQDAGLIFLSSMASTIVQHCRDNTEDDTIMLATVTIVLGCCTAVLGFALIIIGKFKLAQYVQLLPTGVVGGYLAYIGWFCGVSGIGLMANSADVSFYSLFISENSLQNLQFIMPGVVGGILIYLAVTRLRHMAVLPTCIFLLMVLFHSVLWISGISIQQATDNGWIRSLSSPHDDSTSTSPAWFHTWDYLRIDLVDWSVVPKLVLTELSMIFVVALSSSLDVAAIELELDEQARKHTASAHESLQDKPQFDAILLPLDYNRELQTVGLSNLISGLTGGYTGSYIFSQSIFSLRAGIRSPLAGYVLALCQFIVMILPVPILSFVPNFLFGSMLTMICVDLLYEWLWHVRHKVSTFDYTIGWITFFAIQLLGNVEYGIFAGVLIHILYHKIIIGDNLLEPPKFDRIEYALEYNDTMLNDLPNEKIKRFNCDDRKDDMILTGTNNNNGQIVNYGSIQ